MLSCHLASIPQRESLLKIVLESIVPFVDHTFVALSGYNHTPSFIDSLPTVTSRILSNKKGDANKFFFINEISGLALITDDDLTWSPKAINLLQQKVLQYKCPCSYHGKLYRPPIRSFKHINENYRCLNTVAGDHEINCIGTGTLMFDTSMVKLTMDSFPYPNMADILFSKACAFQGVKLMAVEHRAGIVGYLNPPTTIWGNTRDYTPHTNILKSFIK